MRAQILSFRAPRLRSPRCAFTLAEVLLALGLFVVAAGILAGALYSGMQAYRAASGDAQIENRYRLVLRQVLEISDRTEFERGGTLRLPDGTDAEWSAQLRDNPVLVDLLEAEVTVKLRDTFSGTGGRDAAPAERSFTLQLYRTDWQEPTDRSQLLEDRRSALDDRRRGR